MASWMVHLRVADKLLSRIRFLDPVAFVVGNIAPDSGVPNEDWSAFTTSTKISHFKTANGKKADPEAFAAKYFLPCLQVTYDVKQYSFYLGYLAHLMTDTEWSKRIVYPAMDKFAEENKAVSEELRFSMERALMRSRAQQLKEKPSENISKSIALLMEVDTRLFSKLNEDDRDKLRAELDELQKIIEVFKKKL